MEWWVQGKPDLSQVHIDKQRIFFPLVNVNAEGNSPVESIPNKPTQAPFFAIFRINDNTGIKGEA
jgi:hypothetical protein